MSTASKPSPRAVRFWKRMNQWYGRTLAEQFGDDPPPDWCELIDENSDETVRLVLAEIRVQFTTFPPRLPELDALFVRVKERDRISNAGPSMQDRLASCVLMHRSLTPAQIRGPWRYEYRGHPGFGGDPKKHGSRPSPDYAVVAVVVPADGEHPGYRVTVEDMQMDAG